MCDSPSDTQRVLGKRLNAPQGKWPRTRIGVAATIVECTVCGLVFPNPLPLLGRIEDHYAVDPEHYWKDDYFQPEKGYFQTQIKRFKALHSSDGRPRALDVGAGIGKCIRSLTDAGFEAFGIEGSESFYLAAIERNRISPERISLSTIEEASFAAESFDFVTFGAVLEHLYDPSTAILKALTWLRSGGLIHLEVPSSKWLVSRLGNLFYRLTGTDYVANLSPMHPPYHLYEFSLASFERHAARFGYEIAYSRFHVAQTFMPRLVEPLLVKLMRATSTGMQMEVWLRKPFSQLQSDKMTRAHGQG